MKNGFFLLILIVILLNVFRFKGYYIISGSMQPEYPVGTMVIIDQFQKNAVTGIVYAYKKGSMTVVHRLVAETERGYLFKGDANAGCDPEPVAADQIEGKVVLHVKLFAPIVRKLRNL